MRKLRNVLLVIFVLLLCVAFPPLAGLLLGILLFALIWGMFNKGQQQGTNIYVESPRILVVQQGTPASRNAFTQADWVVPAHKQLSP